MRDLIELARQAGVPLMIISSKLELRVFLSKVGFFSSVAKGIKHRLIE